MNSCQCRSAQFVCHAAHGCVCRVGFSGSDCLTPRGQYQELNSGNLWIYKWKKNPFQMIYHLDANYSNNTLFSSFDRSQWCECGMGCCCGLGSRRYCILNAVFPSPCTKLENRNRSCAIHSWSTVSARSASLWQSSLCVPTINVYINGFR